MSSYVVINNKKNWGIQRQQQAERKNPIELLGTHVHVVH